MEDRVYNWDISHYSLFLGAQFKIKKPMFHVVFVTFKSLFGLS